MAKSPAGHTHSQLLSLTSGSRTAAGSGGLWRRPWQQGSATSVSSGHMEGRGSRDVGLL